MKNTGPDNRKKIKEEFKRIHKHLFHEVFLFEMERKRLGRGFKELKCPALKEIARLARKQIGYSPKTIDCDIAWPMYMSYRNNLNTKIYDDF